MCSVFFWYISASRRKITSVPSRSSAWTMPWSARRRPRSSSPWPTACLAASNWAAPWRCWARCIPRPWWPPRIALRSRPSRRICSNLAGLFGEQVGGDVFSRDVPDFWSWLEMFLIFGHGFPMCSHVFPIRKSSDRCFFWPEVFLLLFYFAKRHWRRGTSGEFWSKEKRHHHQERANFTGAECKDPTCEHLR